MLSLFQLFPEFFLAVNLTWHSQVGGNVHTLHLRENHR